MADLLVYGTPNYWYGPSAKMKLLMDRMRPYGVSKKLRGKKAIIISPAAEGPKVSGPLVEMLRLSFDYLGMELVGKVLGTAYDKGEIKNDKKAMNQAYDLGASF
ncbi:MAG: NAD(P)H-dependent oxidoreductase [Deltaproteobacteria bacterium]|nr:NAD(P)H-dependent oxidoreductase [Deltaproteobacteria bacterium]MBW1960137.1 NAD(P)H-dependent oxidoreductase [Deltaproteobacteria bacterium]MBW1994861.1 NAD(P)H-dependent oxidoreductase [Deltaproteobacteria bacterium]MBW2151385.1 NAD(P)H-dependent oxidoreductase [Deltaproteobacteria bacterium]